MFAPIPGWEGEYSINSSGDVRREAYQVEKSAGVWNIKAKIIKSHVNADGYKRVNLIRDGKITLKFAHELVAITFIGQRPDGMFIDHIDRNRTNNSPDNLRYVTRSGNNTGGKLGLDNNYKLNPPLVSEIKKLISSGVSRRLIAEKYNVSRQTINDIA